MYKCLTILTVIILAALCGMGWLGYHSIRIWSQGIEGTRIGEFAEVAEQIRQDVNRKLDAFMAQEQKRPYTDYQYYYIPESIVTGQQQITIENSPLAGQLEHGLAYYNFQIQPDGRITTPNIFLEEQQSGIVNDREENLYAEASLNRKNVEANLLPILNEVKSDPYKLNENMDADFFQKNREVMYEEIEQSDGKIAGKEVLTDLKAQDKRTKNYPIQSLQNPGEKAQIIKQSRELIASNQMQNEAVSGPSNTIIAGLPQDQRQQARSQEQDVSEELSEYNSQTALSRSRSAGRADRQIAASTTRRAQTESSLTQSIPKPLTEENQDDIVEILIEPFVPVLVPGNNSEQSIFNGQVFMLRRVKIEDKSYLQGFQLNEKKLLEEVEESTRRYMRDGMSFELARAQNPQSAYTAILDFVGLGHLMLNLLETDPAWPDRQIIHLKNWYLGIMSFVFLAVTLAVGSLWLNARAQVRLAQKKDDFVSAVSHELRTPLTAIRMHAEMLEKNWVKSGEKVAEYYSNMRAESERLSRLIENVLDFSRIQRGRKKYVFKAGDINKCVEDVVEMMAPYAAQKGFLIKTELSRFKETAFDNDAVTQIVVNLLDNAIKYAQKAEDKTIIVRTRSNDKFIVIEVEDHGPGIPHRQQKKIFEQFYRIGAEATRETAGSGLGLALVKKFAQAHNGFVEIINARPTGAIFRVAIGTRM